LVTPIDIIEPYKLKPLTGDSRGWFSFEKEAKFNGALRAMCFWESKSFYRGAGGLRFPP